MQDQTITPPAAASLLRWYDKHGRADLPWRSHDGRAETAYHTWIAEIMLQQTTVAAVIPYYERFMKRWPRVSDLAAADLDDVLSMWAGLGYYARARNLHRCAQIVTDQYGGEFPADAEELKKLPGIGDYTAASVSAIAYNRHAIVVDGNIERVMSRLFLIDEPVNQPAGKALVRADAARLWPSRRSGDFAQGLMDLGAMVCTPKDPSCAVCPWQKNCKAFATGRMQEFPVKIKIKVNKPRHALAFVLVDGKGQVLLQQRPASGLLGGLWDTPTTPWQEYRWTKSPKSMQFAPSGQVLAWQKQPGTVRHVFSHFPLEITVYKAIWSGPKNKLDPGGQFPDAKIQWAGIASLPALSNLMQKVLTHALASS